MSLKYLVLVLVVVTPAVYSASVKRMSMERMRTADLETSASGYIYTQVSGQPTSYVHFSNNGGSLPIQQYPNVPVVQYYTHPEVPAKIEDAEYVEDHESIEEPAEELEDDKQAYTAEDNAGYSAEGGSEFSESQNSAHGEKGDKGYASKHQFSKGEKGHHDNKHDEGQYAAKGGKKAGHYDAAGQYHSHHEAEKGEKGEKHGEKSSHKKGQKTTGFHNVYHKDEYKKDHTFYDESDNSGYYEKHGDHGAHKSSQNGGYKKGANHESAYQGNKFGKKGSYDRGHYDDADAGFKGEKGQEEYHSSHSDFAKEAGKKGAQEYGYQQGGEKY